MELNGKSIEKAELPIRNIRHDQRAVVAGWGTTVNIPDDDENARPVLPPVLQKQSVWVVGKRQCKLLYRVNTENRHDSFCAHRNLNDGFGICEVMNMNFSQRKR